MNILQDIVSNLTQAPMLAFILGLLAVVLKSDLEIPPQISKFLSLYLLFHIGIKGGQELFHSGFTSESITVSLACIIISFVTPWIFFWILNTKLNIYNAGAVAASYGSISAVNFIAGATFLDTMNIPYGGHMVACMALMESPAVIAGLMIIAVNLQKQGGEGAQEKTNFGEIIHEAMFNGSVLLLIGSMFIGYLAGDGGVHDLKPFVGDIFKGMLCLYMLDMGLLAANKIKEIKVANIAFIGSFALLYPLVACVPAVLIAKLIGLSVGNAFLFTVLITSCSFIAVPASMRLAAPKANMGLLLAMSLGITFIFNVIFGPPLYLPLIKFFFGSIN